MTDVNPAQPEGLAPTEADYLRELLVALKVAEDGDATLVQGHDYSDAFALTWTLSNPPTPDPTT